MVKLVNSGYKSWSIVVIALYYIMKITNTKNNNNKSKLVLFADDPSLFITSPNPTNIMQDINGAFTKPTAYMMTVCCPSWDGTRTTDSQLKSTTRTNCRIYAVYLLTMGYKYAQNM